MASFSSNYLIPTEGLNYLMNIFPRGTVSLPSGTYMGLFTTTWLSGTTGIAYSGTANINLGSGTAGGSSYAVSEASFTGYARQFIPSGSTYWPTVTSYQVGSNATLSGQQVTTNSGYLFTNSGTTTTVWGIFVANSGTAGVTTSGTGAPGTPTVIWYAPFSDLNAVTMASGDQITVTPIWQFAPNAG